MIVQRYNTRLISVLLSSKKSPSLALAFFLHHKSPILLYFSYNQNSLSRKAEEGGDRRLPKIRNPDKGGLRFGNFKADDTSLCLTNVNSPRKHANDDVITLLQFAVKWSISQELGRSTFVSYCKTLRFFQRTARENFLLYSLFPRIVHIFSKFIQSTDQSAKECTFYFSISFLISRGSKIVVIYLNQHKSNIAPRSRGISMSRITSSLRLSSRPRQHSCCVISICRRTLNIGQNRGQNRGQKRERLRSHPRPISTRSGMTRMSERGVTQARQG